MYRQTPTALIAARENEALTHGQVLYGLVKPTKDMDQVESTAAMVNVIPKKRIYRMEKLEELDLFMVELMKRPLVLQPSAHIGRGLAVLGCSFYTTEEKWLLLVNQNHPKVESRIKMAVEAAKKKMIQGLPFVVEISFNKFLKRVYLDRLTKAVLNKKFTFIDFEGADLVIRFPGDRFNRTSINLSQNNDVHLEVEDLLPSEVERRTVSDAQVEWSSPALRVIMPDELHDLMPGWQFENIDPLAAAENEEDEFDDEKLGAEHGGAVGGGYPGWSEVEETHLGAQPTKVIGRARRKADQNQPSKKYEVPVELYVPGSGGPQGSHRVERSPVPLRSPGYGAQQKGNASKYEDLKRGGNVNEHAYTNTRIVPPKSPRSPGVTMPHNGDSAYEEMNVSRQYNQQRSPHGASSPRMPGISHSPGPRTPVSPRIDDQYNMERGDRYSSPRTPVSPRQVTSDDRYMRNEDRYNTDYKRREGLYNTEQVDTTRPSRATYLTDDTEDGGFSNRSPHSPYTPKLHSPGYDANYNKTVETNRYANAGPIKAQYDPRDRYGENQNLGQKYPGQIRPQEIERLSPGSQPVPTPRGFHRQQGSGRSDTSASDSGFGENDTIETSKYKINKNGARPSVPSDLTKTPYYNRAFEQDSPDKDAEIESIMAKHRALAAQAENQVVRNGGSYERTDRYNNPKYTSELKKWRQNINDLEDSCGMPDVQMSRTSIQSGVEESFI
ncbi:uncharacterized protein LOC128232466 [Mya arenaria]|uniref:uncharacterized protein LOC128232466 n=1 Tax=Mya arenaria TaxID=6604 RepID=UPI0022E8FDAD|nr:uncharacterized protein LOC128232466 [Mya arenaria]XP_052802003.1 uncharacterized protein LOC128232466 [Mya arenaria]XP_052802012.1 uncharacterized protein LOC128232466 [Mya arenaria]